MQWIILTAGVLNLFLGLVVWLRDIRNRLNVGFWIFSLSTVFLILLDFVFRYFPTLFILKSSYAFATLVPLTALIWILEICKIKLSSIKPVIRFFLFAPGVLFFFLPYIDGLVVKEISSLTLLGYKGILGPLFVSYSLYFLFYVLIFIILLYKAQNNSSDKLYKLQIRFVILGIFLYGFSALTASLILPNFFNIFDYTLLDAPSLIFFVGFTAYSILKLHLFNIKVIATELLVFSLSGFIFIRALLSEERSEQLINGGMFICIVVVGTFLIKSVIREVSQRERIEKLAKDLQQANDRLRELDRQKSEFVSFATHQLRAPLAAMLGYSSLLLEGEMGKLEPASRNGISRIFDSTRTLVSIVDDYLNITRIELGTMKYAFETISLKQLILDIIAELKPNIDKAKLDFSFEAENSGRNYHVTADRDKLKQVFVNLIDNSIKYTPSGYVKLNLSYNKLRHKFVFVMKDSGVGIDPEVLPRLFQKFSRAKNANKVNIKGTGLGLYVAKEIVEAHHGNIYVDSPGEGRGSTFTVELEPFAKT